MHINNNNNTYNDKTTKTNKSNKTCCLRRGRCGRRALSPWAPSSPPGTRAGGRLINNK